MAFQLSNFLVPYNPTDRALRFMDTNNRIVGGIYVCNFDTIAVESTEVLLLFAGVQSFQLSFGSAIDALAASNDIKTALNTLQPNCSNVVIAPPPDTVAIDVIKSVFDTNRGTNSLIANTVYHVNDTTNQFGWVTGPTSYKLLTNDVTLTTVWAEESSTGSQVYLNFAANTILNYYNSSSKIRFMGLYTNLATSGSANNIYAENSVMNLTNVNNIKGFKSNLTVSNSSEIYAESSVATISNSNKVTLFGINANLSAYSLVSVKLDTRDTFSGKFGQESVSTTGTKLAFVNNQTLFIPNSLGSNINVTLDNIVTNVEAGFKVKVDTSISAGLTVTIKDSSGTTLRIINSNDSGSEFDFVYDLSTTKFKLVQDKVATYKIDVTVSSPGQTTFTNLLSHIPSNTTRAELRVNGQLLRYSSDFTFSGRTMNYISTDYILETDDVVQLVILSL